MSGDHWCVVSDKSTNHHIYISCMFITLYHGYWTRYTPPSPSHTHTHTHTIALRQKKQTKNRLNWTTQEICFSFSCYKKSSFIKTSYTEFLKSIIFVFFIHLYIHVHEGPIPSTPESRPTTHTCHHCDLEKNIMFWQKVEGLNL